MATRYVSTKTAYLTFVPPPADDDDPKTMTLIYGDEVQTTGPETNGKTPVTYRGRAGTIPVAKLDTKPRFECYFLDVGQGDATLIVTPGRKRILIDGGKPAASGRLSEAHFTLNWLYELDEKPGPLVLDLVVLSHADEDHIGGLITLIQDPKIEVKRVIHSGIATYDKPAKDDQLGRTRTIGGTTYLIDRHSDIDELDPQDLSESFRAWVTVLGNEGAETEAVEAGDQIDIGDPTVTVDVLGPRLDHVGGNDGYEWFGSKSHTINGHSVVLLLTYDDVRILLSGDLNIEGGKHLLADPTIAAQLDAHVLKAPHHGSHEFTGPSSKLSTRRSPLSPPGRHPTTATPGPSSSAPSARSPAAPSLYSRSPNYRPCSAKPVWRRSSTSPTHCHRTPPTPEPASGCSSSGCCPASSTSAPMARRSTSPPGSRPATGGSRTGRSPPIGRPEPPDAQRAPLGARPAWRTCGDVTDPMAGGGSVSRWAGAARSAGRRRQSSRATRWASRSRNSAIRRSLRSS